MPILMAALALSTVLLTSALGVSTSQIDPIWGVNSNSGVERGSDSDRGGYEPTRVELGPNSNSRVEPRVGFQLGFKFWV
jgi:hypothetical protein